VNSALVLASHLVGADHFRSEHFEVIGIECVEALSYWKGVEAHWQSDRTLIVVEHDVEVSDELIQGLLDCPHPMCSWAYWLGIPSGGPHWSHRTGLKPPCGGVWVETGDDWADFGGIGFCKIAPSVRVRPLEETDWTGVDCAVSRATEGRVHLHWKRDESGVAVGGVEHFHQ
jgi:hypothetical protein